MARGSAAARNGGFFHGRGFAPEKWRTYAVFASAVTTLQTLVSVLVLIILCFLLGCNRETPKDESQQNYEDESNISKTNGEELVNINSELLGSTPFDIQINPKKICCFFCVHFWQISKSSVLDSETKKGCHFFQTAGKTQLPKRLIVGKDRAAGKVLAGKSVHSALLWFVGSKGKNASPQPFIKKSWL